MPTGEVYTDQTKNKFVAPRCPECGRRLLFRWADVKSPADVGGRWVPSGFKCPGRSCPNSEPPGGGIPGL